MANRNGQRGGFKRFLLEGVDRAFLANRAYDSGRDYWSGQGALQGGIQSGMGAINPGLGLAARMYFNRQNRNNGVMGTRTTPMAPQANFGYQAPQPFERFAPERFDPGQMTPDAPQAPQAPQPQNQNTPMGGQPRQTQQGYSSGGMAGLSGIAAQMGGARGAHSRGGYTGDAARGLFASMTGGPMQFQTFDDRQYQQ